MYLVPSKYNIICEDLNGELLVSNLLYGKHIRIPLEHKQTVIKLLERTKIDEQNDVVSILSKNKILIDNEVDERRLLEYEKQEYLIKQSNTLYLMIVPTQLCNFRCVYCWQENRTGTMSRETISGLKKFIDREAKKCKKIVIEWFGGEPLLAYDTMIEIMQAVDSISKKYHIPYVSIVTTNGSLLTSERFSELLKYRVFSYQITLDGIKKTHNVTRPHKDPNVSSFDLIMNNLRDIRSSVRQRYFEVIVRVNLSTSVEEHLDEFLKMYNEEFGCDKRFTLNFERVENKGGSRILHNTSLIIEDDLNAINDVGKAIQSNNHMHKFGSFQMGMYTCKVLEKNSYNVNYNGDVFMCEMALDNNDLKDINIVGHIDESGICNFDKEKISWWRIPHDNKCCSDCNIHPICLGGVCPLSNNVTHQCNLHNKAYLLTNTMRVYAEQNLYTDVFGELGGKNGENNCKTINERLRNLLLNNGFLSICDNEDEELMFDSIEFVSLIVDIEKEFDIYIPDEYLLQSELNSFRALSKMVEKLCEKK